VEFKIGQWYSAHKRYLAITEPPQLTALGTLLVIVESDANADQNVAIYTSKPQYGYKSSAKTTEV